MPLPDPYHHLTNGVKALDCRGGCGARHITHALSRCALKKKKIKEWDCSFISFSSVFPPIFCFRDVWFKGFIVVQVWMHLYSKMTHTFIYTDRGK